MSIQSCFCYRITYFQIFKICIYNSRRSESLALKSFIRDITEVKTWKEKFQKTMKKKHVQEEIAAS